MPKKRVIAKSLTLHMVLALVMLIFVFSKHSPSQDVPIEIQLNDVHVHRVEPVTPPTHKKVMDESPSLHPVAKTEPAPPPSQTWEKFSDGQRNEYLASLIRLISKHKYYPKASISNEEEGVVQMKVSLSGEGKLLESAVSKSSGYSRLDEAALKTIREIGVFPMPASTGKGIVLLIPIRYEMNPRD